MTPRVSLCFCMFQSLTQEGQPYNQPQLGYRIYDGYSQEYNSTFTNLEDLQNIVRPDTLLEYILEHHPDFYDSVSEEGLYVNGTLVVFDPYME